MKVEITFLNKNGAHLWCIVPLPGKKKKKKKKKKKNIIVLCQKVNN